MNPSADHAARLHPCLARWSTAAFSDGADTLPVDLQSLSAHVQRCSLQHSRGERLPGAAHWAGGVMRVRLMTSVVLLVVALGIALALAA
jgi:hypothetical protein